jgi:hypothetical protein
MITAGFEQTHGFSGNPHELTIGTVFVGMGMGTTKYTQGLWNATAAKMAKYPMKGAPKMAKTCSFEYGRVMLYSDPLINY